MAAVTPKKKNFAGIQTDRKLYLGQIATGKLALESLEKSVKKRIICLGQFNMNSVVVTQVMFRAHYNPFKLKNCFTQGEG